MAVSETQNPCIVFAGFLAVDFHQTKVALAFMGKRVCLGADGEPGGFEGFLDRVDELEMRDRAPAFSGGRRFDFADFIKVHMGGSAVKNEVGSPAGGDNGNGIEVGNHGGRGGLDGIFNDRRVWFRTSRTWFLMWSENEKSQTHH